MDLGYCLFRLAKRELLFTIGLILYVRYVIKKRRFLIELFKKENSLGEEYGGEKSLWLMRIANIFLLIAVLMLGSFWVEIIKDVPYILEHNFSYIQGYTVYKSKGGADVASEMRNVLIRDEQTGKETELAVFSGYIEKDTYMEVEYLPNSGFGVITYMEGMECECNGMKKRCSMGAL